MRPLPISDEWWGDVLDLVRLPAAALRGAEGAGQQARSQPTTGRVPGISPSRNPDRPGLRRRSQHRRGRLQETQERELTAQQQTFNHAHNRLRAIGERGNSLLKITFKALCNVSLDPWRIGDIVAAALTVLHTEHDRTT